VVVVADFEYAEAEEGVAFGEDVEIEEDVFGGILRRFAAVDGVLPAFDGARVIFVTAEGVGNAEVCLQNAGEHFLVERFLKGFGRFEIGVGVVVFGLEIGGYARILFIAEPGVVVHAAVVVDDVLDGFAEGERGLEADGAGPGGRGKFVRPWLWGKIGGSRVGFGSHGCK
jgi:hypothetical protein